MTKVLLNPQGKVYTGNNKALVMPAYKKYNVTIDSIIGDFDSNGVLQPPADEGNIIFTGVKDVGNHAIAYRFYKNKSIKSVSFPDLVTVSGNQSLYYTFCESSVAFALFPELTTISVAGALSDAFYECAYLTSISFPKLTTISSIGRCFNYTFGHCRNITALSFPALTTTSFGGLDVFQSMFDSQSGIDSGTIVMHFPSNLSSTISGLNGYPNFGASSGRLTLSFDLPATS